MLHNTAAARHALAKPHSRLAQSHTTSTVQSALNAV